MNAGHCCEVREDDGPAGEGGATRPPLRAYRGIVGWLVPGVALAVMPKCPACLAAYVAVGTGLALSAPAAAYLRTTLVVVCIGSLGYLGARRIWRVLDIRKGEPSS